MTTSGSTRGAPSCRGLYSATHESKRRDRRGGSAGRGHGAATRNGRCRRCGARRARDPDRAPAPAPHLDHHHVLERIPRHARGQADPRGRDRHRRRRADRPLRRERRAATRGARSRAPPRGHGRSAGAPRASWARPGGLSRASTRRGPRSTSRSTTGWESAWESRSTGCSASTPARRRSPPSRSGSTPRRSRARRCARPSRSPSSRSRWASTPTRPPRRRPQRHGQAPARGRQRGLEGQGDGHPQDRLARHPGRGARRAADAGGDARRGRLAEGPLAAAAVRGRGVPARPRTFRAWPAPFTASTSRWTRPAACARRCA